MPKFMSSHTLPPGAMQREQMDQMAQAVREAKEVKAGHSYMNLSEGRLFCVMEAPDKQTLVAWFESRKLPCDYVAPVEFEGDQGNIQEA